MDRALLAFTISSAVMAAVSVGGSVIWSASELRQELAHYDIASKFWDPIFLFLAGTYLGLFVASFTIKKCRSHPTASSRMKVMLPWIGLILMIGLVAVLTRRVQVVSLYLGVVPCMGLVVMSTDA